MIAPGAAAPQERMTLRATPRAAAPGQAGFVTRARMKCLMMDYQLTIPAMARRAERLHPGKTIVSRQPDGSVHRTTYAEVLGRSKRLIGALQRLGVRRGDRVATI
jgi:long-subunit acyl-CoA synthetase (AMP-forming)